MGVLEPDILLGTCIDYLTDLEKMNCLRLMLTSSKMLILSIIVNVIQPK